METLVPYAVWLVIILVGLSLLTMVLFGIRSLAYGKVNWLTILIVASPFVLMLALGFSSGDWPWAAIFSLVILLCVALLTLLLSGLRSMLSF